MLLDALTTPTIQFANRAVMAPMTRSRAVDANTPNALMAEYYGQRGTAGLIITEGTSPSPNGLGYARKLDAAGVPTRLIECPGMVHGFLRWSGAVPASRTCIDAICAAAKPMLHGSAPAA